MKKFHFSTTIREKGVKLENFRQNNCIFMKKLQKIGHFKKSAGKKNIYFGKINVYLHVFL